jgi:phospholipid/cholesterol/gamma-HCH transport system substrate-binding protein
MQLQENLVEALIGAAVLVVAGWFAFYGYSRTQGGGGAGYELMAKFPQVGGINVGSEVKVSGVKVGTVTSQRLDPKTYQAEIRFTVDKAVQLPIDTIAKITSEGLLGGSYIQLSPGGEMDYLKPGEQIEQTQGSVDLMGLIGQAIYKSGDSKPKDDADE